MKWEAVAKAHKPKLIIAGGSAYSRIIDFKRFREIARIPSARSSWWTWRTSPGLSPAGCIPIRWNMPMW